MCSLSKHDNVTVENLEQCDHIGMLSVVDKDFIEWSWMFCNQIMNVLQSKQQRSWCHILSLYISICFQSSVAVWAPQYPTYTAAAAAELFSRWLSWNFFVKLFVRVQRWHQRWSTAEGSESKQESDLCQNRAWVRVSSASLDQSGV